MKLSNLYSGLYVLASALLISNASADNGQEENETASPIPTFYFSAGRIGLDPELTEQENIKDTATILRFGWEGLSDRLVYGAGMSMFLYSDRAEFSQRVEDVFGNQSTADSSANAFNIYGEVGYSYPLSSYVNVDILGGYEWVLKSERSIGECSNCASEDIDINSGLYITPRIRFTTTGSVILMISQHRYFSGDADDAWSLSIGWQY